MRPYIKDYIASMVETSEARQDMLEQQKTRLTKQHNIDQNFRPLINQIREMMQTMPPQMLNRPWSMEEFVSRFTGKYRPKPHTQMIGKTLRALGWKSVRYWKKGYNGVRLWLPPLPICNSDFTEPS